MLEIGHCLGDDPLILTHIQDGGTSVSLLNDDTFPVCLRIRDGSAELSLDLGAARSPPPSALAPP